MLYNAFTKLVDQALDLGAATISLFGYGEPLLDPTLASKVEYVTYNGASTYLTSNGSHLDRVFSEVLLKGGLSHIRFSVHGIKKSTYETVHPPLLWENVIMNIEEFLNVREGGKYPCTVSVSVIPMHDEKVQEIVEFWDKYPIDYLEIWTPHNWGAALKLREISAAPSRKLTCGRPFNGPVQIQSNGDVIPCCFDFNNEMVMGNALHTHLYEILIGKPYEWLRVRHRLGHHTMVCADCDQLNKDQDNVLLYSSRDPSRETGKTSTCKVSLYESGKNQAGV